MSETILLGCCHILTASENVVSNLAEGTGDEELLTALCQVRPLVRQSILASHVSQPVNHRGVLQCIIWYKH